MMTNKFTLRIGTTLALVGLMAGTLTTATTAGASAPRKAANYPTLTQLKADIVAASQSNNAPDFTKSIPPLSQDNSAVMPQNHQQCFSNGSIPSDPATTCGFGDLTSKQMIFMFGDSQVAQWIPSFNQIGINLHYKIVYLAKPECPPWAPHFPNSGTVCSNFQSSVIALANKWKPMFVMPVGLETTAANQVGWTNIRLAFAATIKDLKPSGAKVILIGSIPHSSPGQDPTICPVVYPTNIQKCERTPQQNASTTIREVAAAMHVTFLDIIPLFCTTTICPIYAAGSDGNHLMYFNYAHMDRQYAAWVSSALQTLVAPYLALNVPVPSPWLPQDPLIATVSSNTATGGTSVPVSVKGGDGNGQLTLSVTGAGCVVHALSVTGPAGATCVVVAKKAGSYAYGATTSAPVSITFHRANS